MGKLEKIIRGCTIGMMGIAIYIISLGIGYTVSNHHMVKSLRYKYDIINNYGNTSKEEHEKYLELAQVHEQKSEKWRELARSVDLFDKLDLYR